MGLELADCATVPCRARPGAVSCIGQALAERFVAEGRQAVPRDLEHDTPPQGAAGLQAHRAIDLQLAGARE
jgi:hypothetical protein